MDLFMDPPPATTNEPLPPPPPPAELPVYMAHAANPTPPLAHNNHNHPPYAEMITEAITALKERNGSSRQAIAKYIEKNYSGLPSNHSALLTHQLRRLKNNGLLLMVKHSYKLPRSVPLSLPSVPTATTVTGNGNGSASGPKRGRGRPRKLTVDAPPNNVVVGSESMLVSLGLADGPAPVSPEEAELGGPVGIRRGPGRPPRPKSFLPVLMSQSELVGADLGGPVVSKRGRGRPPKKLQSLPGLMGQSGLKRRPGRPPRSIGSGRPRGRPRKDASVVNPLGRKRGRKPKNAAAAAAVLGGGGSSGGGEGGFGAVAGGVLPVKRRGRLPRAGGVKKPRKLTGRPLGRPRKDASISGIQVAATQQLVAYEDLKGKLEFFKSRIQQAVVTVKPHLNPETAMSAFGALQELEELVTMDLNAPLNVQVHIQVQEPLIHN